jgi:hypothetical protein
VGQRSKVIKMKVEKLSKFEIDEQLQVLMNWVTEQLQKMFLNLTM